MAHYADASTATLPKRLHDVAQARELVNTWTARMFHFVRKSACEPINVPLETFAKAAELHQTFSDLDTLLWEFMHQPNTRLSAREQHGLAMLRSRVKTHMINSATCLYTEASIFDQYLEQFGEILTICTYIISNAVSDWRLSSISLDEGFLQPLFFIATHCRHSVLRREALRQMEKLPLRTSYCMCA